MLKVNMRYVMSFGYQFSYGCLNSTRSRAPAQHHQLAALVLRDGVLPERIPAAGLIILRDGQPVALSTREFDLLQALNTGHLGSLTTIHANSAEQAPRTRGSSGSSTATAGAAPRARKPPARCALRGVG